MSFTVTDQNVLNEIQYHLLEAPNNGASYGSSLYTAAEIVNHVNLRLKEFIKRTSVLVKRDTSTTNTSAGVRSVTLPTDCIDLLRVAMADTAGNVVTIPLGGSIEADTYYSSLTSTVGATSDVPYIATLAQTPHAFILYLYPNPAAARALDLLYVKQPAVLPDTPNGTVLECPDDFTPFVKYGAMADIFSKSGETYDPERANLCQQLFELGVSLAAKQSNLGGPN